MHRDVPKILKIQTYRCHSYRSFRYFVPRVFHVCDLLVHIVDNFEVFGFFRLAETLQVSRFRSFLFGGEKILRGFSRIKLIVGAILRALTLDPDSFVGCWSFMGCRTVCVRQCSSFSHHLNNYFESA